MLADRLEGRFVHRAKFSLPQLRLKYKEDRILLVTQDEIRFFEGDAPPVFFHPGTAAIRAKRLLNGEHDVMLKAAKAEAGDKVIDCTAGMASDAIIFSLQVGGKGSVTALESEQLVHMLIEEGLSTYDSDVEGLNEAMRRIELVHQHHLAYLQGMPDRSADIIFFDPMFRDPISESSGIKPLRSIVNPGEIQQEAIAEARRVARKTVVLKEGKESGEFERLGFKHVIRSTSKIAYGVIDC
jgi:16S rRNA (guanine1516-N2)-methyltransferase